MKKFFQRTSLLLAAAFIGAATLQAQKSPQDMDRFIDALIKRMTVEEKIGQLNLPVTGEITTGQAKSSDVAKKIEQGLVGGLFNLKGVAKIRDVQKLAVEAAVHADISLLRQAAMMDPLTGAVCTPDEIIQMVDEMLVTGAEWLPQYAEEIESAKKRLENKSVPYRTVKGFTLKEKSIEEMAEEKAKYRALAGAAAKENV